MEITNAIIRWYLISGQGREDKVYGDELHHYPEMFQPAVGTFLIS